MVSKQRAKSHGASMKKRIMTKSGKSLKRNKKIILRVIINFFSDQNFSVFMNVSERGSDWFQYSQKVNHCLTTAEKYLYKTPEANVYDC